MTDNDLIAGLARADQVFDRKKREGQIEALRVVLSYLQTTGVLNRRPLLSLLSDLVDLENKQKKVKQRRHGMEAANEGAAAFALDCRLAQSYPLDEAAGLVGRMVGLTASEMESARKISAGKPENRHPGEHSRMPRRRPSLCTKHLIERVRPVALARPTTTKWCRHFCKRTD